MHKDRFGQFIFTEEDICSLYLTDPDKKLVNLLVDKQIIFDNDLELSNVPKIHNYIESNLSIEDFDVANQQKWFIPKEYLEMDIAKFVLDQCKNDSELQRAGEELLLFHERDMFTLLKYLKYLVDTMRQNNIVWGVGRGSSVASFVLFLLGVHKINSLYYDLSIDEFIK